MVTATGNRQTATVEAGLTRLETHMLLVGMIVLGLATFAAMLGFVTFCDRI